MCAHHLPRGGWTQMGEYERPLVARMLERPVGVAGGIR